MSTTGPANDRRGRYTTGGGGVGGAAGVVGLAMIHLLSIGRRLSTAAGIRTAGRGTAGTDLPYIHMPGRGRIPLQQFDDPDHDEKNRPRPANAVHRVLVDEEQHTQRDEHDRTDVAAAPAAGAGAGAVATKAVHAHLPVRRAINHTPMTIRMIGHRCPIQCQWNMPRLSSRKMTPSPMSTMAAVGTCGPCRTSSLPGSGLGGAVVSEAGRFAPSPNGSGKGRRSWIALAVA